MKFTFFKIFTGLAILVMVLFSCSSELDFEQASDFNTQPVFTTNLGYLEKNASDFIINGMEQPSFSYTSNVGFFNTLFFKQKLIQAEFYFRIKNTVNRAYIYNVVFFDKNDVPIYSINLNVPAYNGTEILVEKTEVFTTTNVAILKNTTKMGFSISMLPGMPISASTTGRVELSSSLTAYFDIK